MKNSITYIALLLCGLSACDNKLTLPGSSTELDEGMTLFSVNYTVAPSEGINETPEGTRSSPADVDNDKVTNVWVFQFDGTTDQSKLLTPPRYMETKGDGTLSIGAIPSTTDQRILFIANTNQSTIDWKAVKGATTYQQIINVSGQRTREDQHYGQSNRNLLMNGVLDGPIELGKPLTPTLHRAMAKVTLSLELASDYGLEVTSVRLCNIPSKIVWADYLYPYSSNEISPTPIETTFLSCEPDVQTIMAGGSNNYQWYVPSNRKGSSPATSSKEKNKYAPGGATYIEITAINPTSSTHEGRIYRIYPGTNMIDDYNILSNRNHKLTLRLTQTTKADDRVETIADKVFDELSNCYILNPPLAGSKPRVYSIPVVDRVNEFYNNGYESIDRSNFLGFTTSNSKWECRIIWSDNPNLVYNKHSDVSADKCLSFVIAKGNGSDQKHLQVQLPTLTQDQQGSVLVGIYEEGGTKCRWSWHLWITDYNPNVPVSIRPDQFTYNVPEGQVIRLATNGFGYSESLNPNAGITISNSKYRYISTPTKDSPYAQGYMMDRNVGTRTAYGRKESNSGFYYQFGRKDPFNIWRSYYHYMGDPNAEIYAPYETKSTSSKFSLKDLKLGYTTDKVFPLTMSDAIENPTTFLSSNTTGCTYLGTVSASTTPYDNEITSRYQWHDLKIIFGERFDAITKEMIVRKSLFDPCPAGWQILNGTDFGGPFYPSRTLLEEFNEPNRVTHSRLPHPRGLNYMGAQGDGMYYWPLIKDPNTDLFPVNGVIYFPETGYILQNGEIEIGNTSGIWFASRAAGNRYTTYGNNLNYSKIMPRASYTEEMIKTQAFPVRCVKNPPVIP